MFSYRNQLAELKAIAAVVGSWDRPRVERPAHVPQCARSGDVHCVRQRRDQRSTGQPASARPCHVDPSPLTKAEHRDTPNFCSGQQPDRARAMSSSAADDLPRLPFSDLWTSAGSNHSVSTAGRPRAVTLRRTLLSSLGNSSRRHSREALRCFTSAEEIDLLHAATSVGMASELLLKLFIGRTSLELLADKGHTDSLLMLAAHPSVATRPVSAFRSIAAGQALTLAKKMGLTVPGPAGEFSPFIVRNSAAHLAMIDTEELAEAVEHHAALAGAIFDHLNIDPKSFWGEDHWPTVEQLIVAKVDRDWARYIAKIAAAKGRFAELSERLGPSTLAALRAVSKPRTSISFGIGANESIDYVCPACGSTGQIIYLLEDEGPVQFEPDGAHWIEQSAVPMFFECPICELELDDDEVSRIPGAEDYVPDGREVDNEELDRLDYEYDLYRHR